jgi:hypothetical protein
MCKIAVKCISRQYFDASTRYFARFPCFHFILLLSINQIRFYQDFFCCIIYRKEGRTNHYKHSVNSQSNLPLRAKKYEILCVHVENHMRDGSIRLKFKLSRTDNTTTALVRSCVVFVHIFQVAEMKR